MTDELEEDLQDLLLALVAIDSQNPSLVGGADGEGAIADLVTGWAARAGLDVERIEPTPGRPSLLVTAHGTAPADTPSLLLCGHLDTVGIGAAGLVPHVEGDQVHGRGAYDMKGGVAAALLAMREAVRRRAAGAFYQAGELLDAAPLAADVGEAVEQLVEELAHPWCRQSCAASYRISNSSTTGAECSAKRSTPIRAPASGCWRSYNSDLRTPLFAGTH